jgi:hypothetical protein
MKYVQVWIMFVSFNYMLAIIFNDFDLFIEYSFLQVLPLIACWILDLIEASNKAGEEFQKTLQEVREEIDKF